MWMRQLFGCGIFPHTGSHQSRLTGHWLHWITERPGLEKKKKKSSQATDVQPETIALYPPFPPLHPTTTPKNCSFLFSQAWTRVCNYRALLPGPPRLFYSRATLHYLQKKAKPISSELTGRHKKADKSPENIFLSPVIVHNHILKNLWITLTEAGCTGRGCTFVEAQKRGEKHAVYLACFDHIRCF